MCSCMGSVSVSSCRCCIFVSCVAVLNAAFCMTFRLLMLVVVVVVRISAMFISIWVPRIEIAEFPDSVRRSAP